MARIINVPGVGEARVPDNATDADIVSFVKKVQEAGSVKAAYDKALAERPGAFMSGVYGAGASLAAAGGAGAEAVGFDPLANTLYGAAESLGEEQAKFAPEVPSYTDIGGIGDALTYLKEQGLASAPYMGATVLGGVLGGPFGAGAVSFPLMLGENLRAQAQARDISLRDTDAGRAAIAAIPQTALDIGSFGIATGVFKNILRSGTEAAKRTATRQLLSSVLKSGAAESLTESAQQAIQIAQADPDRLAQMDDATIDELLNAAVAGGLLGGVVGGGFQFVGERAKTKAEEQQKGLEETIQREGDAGRQLDLRSEANLGVETLQSRQATPNLEIKKIRQVVPKPDGTTEERDVYAIRDLGDKTKGKVNIGPFASEEAARAAIDGYKSLIVPPSPLAPKATPTAAPAEPKINIKTEITGEPRKAVQPPLPAEAPTPAPGLGKAASELPKAPDAPVPESPKTLDLQREALRSGKRKAMLYQPSDEKPVIAGRNIKRITLDDGRVIDFNRKLIKEQDVRAAVEQNRLNDILDLGPFNKDEVMASQMQGNAPVSVVERAPDGTEVKAAGGTTATAPAQVAAMEQAKLAPENNVVVEPREKVVLEREAAARSTADLPEIDYDTSVWDSNTNTRVRQSGKARIIDYSGRKIVLKNVNGVLVPFYLSSGAAGKAAPAGKWYPFFGIGKDGWINKTSSKDMVEYYGSPELRQAALELDSTIGDIRDDQSIPKVGATGKHIDIINAGLNPSENGMVQTAPTVDENIRRVKEAIAKGAEAKSKQSVAKEAKSTKKPSATREITADEIQLDPGQVRAIRESIIPSGRVVDAPMEKRKEFFFAVQAAKQREADFQNQVRAERASPKEQKQSVFEDLSDDLMGMSADDAPKSRYRAFIKKAIKLGAMTEADAKELEYIFKDKDMSNDDLNSEIGSILRANESDQEGGKILSVAPAGGTAPVPAIAILASRPELAAKFGEAARKRLAALGLGRIGLDIKTAVQSGEFGRYGEGAYDPKTKAIEISLSAVDPSVGEAEFIAKLSEVIDHEAIHAIVDMGVLTKAEFASLLQDSARTKYPGSTFSYLERAAATYSTLDQYKNADGTVNREAIGEEAVAEMFRDWNAGRLKVADKPRGLFARIREFFRRLRGAGKEAGFDKIFAEIKSGKMAERQAAPTEGGGRKLSVPARLTGESEQEFSRWWGDSKAVDDNGEPMVYYRGDPKALRGGELRTRKDYLDMSAGLPGKTGPFYFSPKARFAEGFALADNSKGGFGKPSKRGVMYPVYLSVQNPYEFNNEDHNRAVSRQVAMDRGAEIWTDAALAKFITEMSMDLATGSWNEIERLDVQKAIRSLGFDGFYVMEGGVKNLAVYDPSQAKSIFNQFEPGAATSRKLAIAPRYTRDNEQYEPDRNARGSVIKFITQGMKSRQADAAFARLDEANRRYPNPLSDPQSWLNRLSFAYNQRDGVLMPPNWLIGMTNDLPRWAQWMKLTPDQLKTVNQGFDLVDQLNAAYKNGTATPEVTGNLFMWVYMSRMASAFPHEAGYLDVADKAAPFIRKAISGKFTASPELLSMTATGKAAKQAKANAGFAEGALPADVAVPGRSDLDDWFLMVRDALPDDSPGNAVTNNLNSFGRDFLFTMAKKQDGKTKLNIIHEALVSDKSGKDVRRLFHKVRDGGKVGFDNKILSFALLLAGKRDVVVLDRIQINQLFGGGQTNKIYDDVAKGFDGPRGLAVYEALEAGINQKIEELYNRLGRPQDGSTGRLHWESWIRSSGQEVAHPTIKALVDLANGKSNPFLDIGAREGRFHRTMFGVQYIRRAGGKQDFVYTTRSGAEFAFDKEGIDNILSSTNLKKNDIVPKWFPGVSDFEGGAISWRDYPGVKIGELERIIATKGRPINNEAVREKSAVRSGVAKGTDVAGSGGRGGASAADAGNRVRWELGRRPAGGSNKARIPESFDRKDRTDADGNVIAEYTLKPRAEEIFREAGVATPTFLELAQNDQNAKRFADAIAKAKDDNPNGAAVLLYDKGDYAKMRLFLTEDGMTGFAIKDGTDIVSVFNNPKSGRRAASITMLQLAIQQGGRKLDCFDTILPTLYSNSGMVATSRIKFSDRQKPAEWDYDSFADFNSGRPDVVFMVFDPTSWSVYKPTDGDLVNTGDTEEAENNDYGTAAEIQSKAIYNEDTSAEANQKKGKRKLSVPPAYNNVNPLSQAEAEKVISGLTYGAATDSLQRILDRYANNPIIKRVMPKRFIPGKRSAADFMRKFVDNMLPVGELIDYIRKNGGTVADAMDTYMQADITHSTVANDLLEREDGLYKAPLDFIAKNGLILSATNEQAAKGIFGVEDYLYAKHAIERNEVIRERGNPDPEKGSGMTDDEAKAILAAIDRMPQAAKIKEAAKLVYDIIKNTNEIRVANGLTPDFANMEVVDEDGNTVRADLTRYKYYVPLRGFAEENPELGNVEEELRARIGTGFNVRGREDKQALGRKSRASDIIAHAILQNTEAVIRAGKNRVANSLIKLVEANPKQAEEFGIKILKKAPTKLVLNKSGVIQSMVDPMYKMRDDILIAKAMPDVAKGLKGGEQVILEVNNEGLQKALIAKKVAGPAMMEKLLTMAQGINRWIALVNTGVNPEFMPINFGRDLQTALINIEQYKTPGLRKKMAKDVLPAMRGAWNVIRNPDAKGKWEDAFRQFKKAGGMTAGIAGINGISERIASIEKMMKQPTGSYAERAKLAGKAAVDFVLDMNSAAENAIRLSVFKNLIENGFSEARAAQAAKNLTVNFDRRGEYGPVLNSLYLFFNASIQGSFAIAMAAARSPKVRKILGGIVVFGMMQDLLNSLLSPEDDDGKKIYDKIPDYKLRTNLIIMDPIGIAGDRGYISIPMPYGYNAVHNLGRTMMRKLRGEYTTMEATNNIVGTFVDAFNPIGGTENMLNAIAPTVVDPVVSLYLNEDFTGKKIYPEAFPGATPKSDSNTFWSSTSPTFKSLAQFLNSATGGSEYVPGLVDISPDVMEYWYDYFLGGAGAFVKRTWDTATSTIPAALSGDLENLELNNVPILRRLVGNVSDRIITEGYMENANYILARGKEMEAAVKSGDPERIKETREKYKDTLRVYPRVKMLVNRRNQIASDLRKLRENPRVPADQKRVRIQQMQKQIVQITGEVNQIYAKLKDNQTPSVF